MSARLPTRLALSCRAGWHFRLALRAQPKQPASPRRLQSGIMPHALVRSCASAYVLPLVACAHLLRAHLQHAACRICRLALSAYRLHCRRWGLNFLLLQELFYVAPDDIFLIFWMGRFGCASIIGFAPLALPPRPTGLPLFPAPALRPRGYPLRNAPRASGAV